MADEDRDALCRDTPISNISISVNNTVDEVKVYEVKVDEVKTHGVDKVDEVKVDEVKTHGVDKFDEVKVDEVKAHGVDTIDEVQAHGVDNVDEVKVDEVKTHGVDKVDEVKVDEDKVEEVKVDEDKVDEVNGVDTVDDVKGVDKVIEVDEIKKVDKVDEVKVGEIKGVYKIDEVKGVDTVDEVKDDEAIALDKVDEVNAVDKVDMVKVDDVKGVYTVDEVSKVDKVDEVKGVDKVDEVKGVYKADEVKVDEVKRVDMIGEANIVDNIDEVKVDEFTVDDVNDEVNVVDEIDEVNVDEVKVDEVNVDEVKLNDIKVHEVMVDEAKKVDNVNDIKVHEVKGVDKIDVVERVDKVDDVEVHEVKGVDNGDEFTVNGVNEVDKLNEVNIVDRVDKMVIHDSLYVTEKLVDEDLLSEVNINDYFKYDFGWFDFVFGIISIIFFVADIGSDIYLATQHFQDGQTGFGGVTIFLVAGPSLIVCCVGGYWYLLDYHLEKKKTREQNKTVNRLWTLRFVCTIFQIGPLIRTAEFVFYGWKFMQSVSMPIKAHYYKKMIFEYVDNNIIRLFESILESASQLAFQLYAWGILNPQDDFINVSIRIFQIVTSCGSLGLSFTGFHKGLRYSLPHKKNLSKLSTLFYVIFRSCEVGARILCISMFAVVFKYWVFLPLLAHWIFVTVWNIQQNTHFCARTSFEYFFSIIYGYVMIFLYVNMQEGHSRFRYILYYVLFYLENLIIFVLWLYFKPFGGTWYTVQIVLVIVLSTFHIMFQLIYYKFFHPEKIQICLPCNRDTCFQSNYVAEENESEIIMVPSQEGRSGSDAFREIELDSVHADSLLDNKGKDTSEDVWSNENTRLHSAV